MLKLASLIITIGLFITSLIILAIYIVGTHSLNFHLDFFYSIVILNFIMTVYGLNAFLYRDLDPSQIKKLKFKLKFSLPISILSFIWYVVDSIKGAIESSLIRTGIIEVLFWLLLLASLVFATLKVFDYKKNN